MYWFLFAFHKTEHMAFPSCFRIKILPDGTRNLWKIYPRILEKINNKFASGMFSTIFERFTTKPVYDKFNAEYGCILFMHETSTKIDVKNA